MSRGNLVLRSRLIRRGFVQPVNSLGVGFDPRANGLNALRLLLAIFVIVWHSFPLTGADIAIAPLRQLVSRLSVDGFFAISGFLIVSSWMRHPRWGVFLRARVLRIFPAFWVCLLVTASAVAPFAVILRGAEFSREFAADAVGYVTHNLFLRVGQFDIAGTPLGVPSPAVWNGSMWTLFWEFSCYMGVLLVGVLGLLRRRETLPVLYAVTTIGVLATSYGPIQNGTVQIGCRLGLMFLAGALIHRLQDRIPVSPVLLVAAGAVIGASAWLPEYSVISALPLAYLMISVGAIAKHPHLRIRNDLSYGIYIYGFPLQQLLATAGAAAWGVPAFALASVALTLPFAAASWFLVEKPALRWKGVPRAPSTVKDAAAAHAEP